MASGRFRQPPRLRTIESGEDDRRATWLELFFDLVFVAAVAELSLNLIDDPSLGGLLGYLGLFVPVWWAWMGFTFYANRFDSDDLAYRLLTLAGMFAVAALATTVHGALDDGQLGFTIAYVSIRCALLFLYGRAIVHVEVGRRLAAWYFTVFGFAVLIWTASLLFGGPLRYWLWALALSDPARHAPDPLRHRRVAQAGNCRAGVRPRPGRPRRRAAHDRLGVSPRCGGAGGVRASGPRESPRVHEQNAFH